MHDIAMHRRGLHIDSNNAAFFDIHIDAYTDVYRKKASESTAFCVGIFMCNIPDHALYAAADTI